MERALKGNARQALKKLKKKMKRDKEKETQDANKLKMKSLAHLNSFEVNYGANTPALTHYHATNHLA